MKLEDVIKDLEKDLEVFKEYLLSIDFVRNEKDIYLYKDLSIKATISWSREGEKITIEPRIVIFKDHQFIFRGGIIDGIDYLLLSLKSENKNEN